MTAPSPRFRSVLDQFAPDLVHLGLSRVDLGLGKIARILEGDIKEAFEWETLIELGTIAAAEIGIRSPL